MVRLEQNQYLLSSEQFSVVLWMVLVLGISAYGNSAANARLL